MSGESSRSKTISSKRRQLPTNSDKKPTLPVAVEDERKVQDQKLLQKAEALGLTYKKVDITNDDDLQINKSLSHSILSLIPFTKEYYEFKAAEYELNHYDRIQQEKLKALELVLQIQQGNHHEALAKLKSETDKDFFYFNKLRCTMKTNGKYETIMKHRKQFFPKNRNKLNHLPPIHASNLLSIENNIISTTTTTINNNIYGYNTTTTTGIKSNNSNVSHNYHNDEEGEKESHTSSGQMSSDRSISNLKATILKKLEPSTRSLDTTESDSRDEGDGEDEINKQNTRINTQTNTNHMNNNMYNDKNIQHMNNTHSTTTQNNVTDTNSTIKNSNSSSSKKFYLNPSYDNDDINSKNNTNNTISSSGVDKSGLHLTTTSTAISSTNNYSNNYSNDNNMPNNINMIPKKMKPPLDGRKTQQYLMTLNKMQSMVTQTNAALMLPTRTGVGTGTLSRSSDNRRLNSGMRSARSSELRYSYNSHQS